MNFISQSQSTSNSCHGSASQSVITNYTVPTDIHPENNDKNSDKTTDLPLVNELIDDNNDQTLIEDDFEVSDLVSTDISQITSDCSYSKN